MADDLTLSTLVPKALRTLLTETLLRAGREGAYIINRGEPGFVDTLKSLSAGVVSSHPGHGRKPIVSHANHVLFGLTLVARALDGDQHAFDDVDWDEAWKLEQVDDDEWAALVGKLESTAEQIIDNAPTVPIAHEIMFTGLLGVPAHTAYHLGAVRQILREVKAYGDHDHRAQFAGNAGDAIGQALD